MGLLTVQDVLARPIFREAELVAGQAGVGRPVRWVHVLEVPDAHHSLHGQELVLTIGMGMQDEQSRQLYLGQMIQYGVAAVCLELGDYLFEVPEDMKRIADRGALPLIVFRNPVKFIDITQDIHSLIVSQRDRQLLELEALSRELRQASQSPDALTTTLARISSAIGGPVALLPASGPPLVHPAEAGALFDGLVHSGRFQHLAGLAAEAVVLQVPELGERRLAVQAVYGAGLHLGLLAASMDIRHSGDYLSLLLDRAANTIGQILLHRQSQDERRAQAEAQWVEDLVHGRFRDEGVLQSSLDPGQPLPTAGGAVVLIATEAPSGDGGGSFGPRRLAVSLTARRFFREHGFHAFVAARPERLILGLAAISGGHADRGHIARLINQFRSRLRKDHGISSGAVGAAQFQGSLLGAERAYRQAYRALGVAQQVAGVSPFFEDLGVYRLLGEGGESGEAARFALDLLQPLIDYDRQNGGNLTGTLRAYLDARGSKELAARALYIHRQTLYYRIRQIKLLLGPGRDPDETEASLALAVALRALDLGKGKGLAQSRASGAGSGVTAGSSGR